jgi:DnaK suppressor protein
MQAMDSQMMAALEHSLLQRRTALAGTLRARRHADGEDELALLHQECRQLEAVERALASLADGSYGLCHGCGRAIAPARLLAQPSAALCLDCQQDSERRYHV